MCIYIYIEREREGEVDYFNHMLTHIAYPQWSAMSLEGSCFFGAAFGPLQTPLRVFHMGF